MCLLTRDWNCKVFSYDNIRSAELAIWTTIQSDVYSAQLAVIRKGKTLSKNDPLIKLSPVIGNDGLLRVGGKLHCSSESYSIERPIIIPSDNDVVKCLIRNYHVKVGHMGRDCLVTALREIYWIVKANVVIKQLLRSCMLCTKLNSRPCETFMSSLPEERVSADKPVFHSTGINFFGSFMTSRGRAKSAESCLHV